MEITGDELGPPAAVSDERLLLAIGRARDHADPGDERRVHRKRIAEHLGFAHSSTTTKLLQPQLEAMEGEGLLEAVRSRGADYWRLTPKGSRRVGSLRKSKRSESLPESPQHREWRQAKEVAQAQLPEIMEDLHADLERGLELGNSSFHRFAGGDVSLSDLRRLGVRLKTDFSLFATGLYCLFEWSEPSDAKRDPKRNPSYGDLRPGSWRRGPRDERSDHDRRHPAPSPPPARWSDLAERSTPGTRISSGENPSAPVSVASPANPYAAPPSTRTSFISGNSRFRIRPPPARSRCAGGGGAIPAIRA
jgi:hypothetical protein